MQRHRQHVQGIWSVAPAPPLRSAPAATAPWRCPTGPRAVAQRARRRTTASRMLKPSSCDGRAMRPRACIDPVRLSDTGGTRPPGVQVAGSAAD